MIEAAQAASAVREDTTVPRLWALRPELAKAQLPLHTRYHDSNIIDARLLELVRLRIAALNDCTACKVARKTDDVSEDEIAFLSSDGTCGSTSGSRARFGSRSSSRSTMRASTTT